MKHFTFLLFIFMITSYNLYAQIEVVGICDDINSIHELSTLDGFNFDIAQNTSTSEMTFCDSDDPIENPNWLAFTVLPYYKYDFQVSFTNCTASQTLDIGGQLAIYEICDDLTNPIYCQSQPIVGPHTIPNDLEFEVGKTYYLLLDGYNSMLCDVAIHVEKYMPMESVTDWFSVSFGFLGSSNYSYSAIGDTIINNLLYRIITSEPNAFFTRYLRENTSTKKVYTYNEFSGQESLLYDFSATIGDVVSLSSGSYEVTSIDYLEGVYGELKRWTLDGPGPPIKVTEGIGSEDLFLANTASDPVFSLLCAYHETDKIFGNEDCSPSIRWPTDLDVIICEGESYTIGGIEYTESGTYPDTIMTASGQDSIVITNLSVLPISETLFEESLCEDESIIIDGVIFDKNNPTGTVVLANASANSCDSILSISLSFIDNIENEISEIACHGDTVVFNEMNYYEAGTYTEQFSSSMGCDSLVTLILEFSPKQFDSDTLYFCEGDSVLVNDTYIYDEEVIENIYVSSLGCDSTQLTVTVFLPNTECTTQTNDPTLPAVIISPNPFSNTIDLRAQSTIRNLVVFDIFGSKIAEIVDINLQKYTLDGSQLISGVYLIMIQTEHQLVTRKIVKE